MKISQLMHWLLGKNLMMHAMEDGGGEDGDNGEAVGSRNDERLAMLDQIGDSAEERRKDEFDEDQDFSGEKVEEVHQQEARLPKIKVNGAEIELTPELIERAQKVEAADQYLSEAARLKREAEQQYTAPPSRRDVVENVEVDDMALVRALQMGTEEEAAAAIRALRAPSFTKDEMLQAARDQIAMDQAVKKFQSEYPQIWEDPMLTKLAFDLDNELIKTTKLDYGERYDKIGKQLTEWSGKLNGGMKEKKERKESASENVVQISSRRAEPVQQEEQEESTSDVIGAMARKRGQIF